MSDLPPDPYAALGVSKDADAATIKAKYRKLVLQCHPDKVVDPALKAQKADEFQRIQQAYELVGDDERRVTYDAEVKLDQLRREKRERERGQRSDASPPPTRRARPDTMEGLGGMINGEQVFALCDTGADMNFIAEHYAKELRLEISYTDADERPSFVMGHGRRIYAIGSLKATWSFHNDARPSKPHRLLFYILKDCIFNIMIGANFLNRTETMTKHRYRLCRIPKPQFAIRTRFVNLCGTPSRRIRGSLRSEQCSALPDSGAEPNLLSYEYVEKRGWLLDMFPGPESCRLLQFADGSTENTAGRLRLQWDFVTGWGPARPDSRCSVDFDVLRGCPFDVVLGSDFLDDTEAFTKHEHSFQDVIQNGPSGLNIVIWAKQRPEKRKERPSASDGLSREGTRRYATYDESDDELERQLEERAQEEWKNSRRARDLSRRGSNEFERNHTRTSERQYTHVARTVSPTRWPQPRERTREPKPSQKTYAYDIGRPGHTPPPNPRARPLYEKYPESPLVLARTEPREVQPRARLLRTTAEAYSRPSVASARSRAPDPRRQAASVPSSGRGRNTQQTVQPKPVFPHRSHSSKKPSSNHSRQDASSSSPQQSHAVASSSRAQFPDSSSSSGSSPLSQVSTATEETSYTADTEDNSTSTAYPKSTVRTLDSSISGEGNISERFRQASLNDTNGLSPSRNRYSRTPSESGESNRLTSSDSASSIPSASTVPTSSASVTSAGGPRLVQPVLKRKARFVKAREGTVRG